MLFVERFCSRRKSTLRNPSENSMLLILAPWREYFAWSSPMAKAYLIKFKIYLIITISWEWFVSWYSSTKIYRNLFWYLPRTSGKRFNSSLFSTINRQNPLLQIWNIYLRNFDTTPHTVAFWTLHPLLQITIIKISFYRNQTILKLEILLKTCLACKHSGPIVISLIIPEIARNESCEHR
jgi:hypothetical protein